MWYIEIWWQRKDLKRRHKALFFIHSLRQEGIMMGDEKMIWSENLSNVPLIYRDPPARFFTF